MTGVILGMKAGLVWVIVAVDFVIYLEVMKMSQIEELPQWGVWICKWRGKVSYHAEQHHAQAQLDIWEAEALAKKVEEEKCEQSR